MWTSEPTPLLQLHKYINDGESSTPSAPYPHRISTGASKWETSNRTHATTIHCKATRTGDEHQKCNIQLEILVASFLKELLNVI